MSDTAEIMIKFMNPYTMAHLGIKSKIKEGEAIQNEFLDITQELQTFCLIE